MTTETAPGAAALLPPVARVLAVVDPDSADDTLTAAAALAQRQKAHLDVLTCLAPPADLAAIARASGIDAADLMARLRDAQYRRVSERVRERLPGREAAVHVAVGKAYVEVIRHVLAQRVDMVVKAADRLSGLQGLLFTSTDQHLLRKCPCPVWLRTAGARAEPRTVVAAVDVDDWDASEPETLADLNRRVVGTAMRLAGGAEGVVHVLHAWEAVGEGLIWTFSSGPDPSAVADNYVKEIENTRRLALTDLMQSFDPVAATEGPRLVEGLVRGPARTVLAQEAKRLAADVLVMGTIARTGLGGVIIGNTAEDVINSVECSVVAVKPQTFVTPLQVEGKDLRGDRSA